MKHFLLALILLCSCGIFFTNQAHAQVYKCTAKDSSGADKVVYTDVPCANRSKQTLTNIQATSKREAEIAEQNLFARDQAVTQAVLAGDLKRAKALAVTKQHKKLIALAEGETSKIASVPQPSQVILASNDPTPCERASQEFESASRLSWRDEALISTKREVMHAVCGISPPMAASQPAIGVVGGFGGAYATPYAYGVPHGFEPYRIHQGHRGFGPRWGSPRGNVQRFPHDLQQGASIGLNYRNRNSSISIRSAAPLGVYEWR